MSTASEFRLVSEWRIDAPRERVWAALKSPKDWPSWWRYVARVDELDRGYSSGVGARHRFHWTSRLPYAIDIEMLTVEMRERELIRASASGDLQGEGLWELCDAPEGTLARYTWRVTLDKAWMRALAPLLRPVFAWNHNAVMAAGEAGLRAMLAGESNGALPGGTRQAR